MDASLKFRYANLGGRGSERKGVATELGHPGNGSVV